MTNFSNASQSGYVMAGRSLREVEKREAKLSLEVFLGWLVSVGATFLAAVILSYLINKK